MSKPQPVRVDPVSGRIHPARQVSSPNFDQRPQGVEAALIIVHGISLPPGEFGGPHIDRLFTNTLVKDEHPYFAGIADSKVSAHVLIRRHGELVQYVSIHQRAWHAGVSSFGGRSACNDFSVGIELEGSDDVPYTDIQYRRLCATIAALGEALPGLRAAPVVGHCHVAPGRKTDPGPAFDWNRLRGLLPGHAVAGPLLQQAGYSKDTGAA